MHIHTQLQAQAHVRARKIRLLGEQFRAGACDTYRENLLVVAGHTSPFEPLSGSSCSLRYGCGGCQQLILIADERFILAVFGCVQSKPKPGRELRSAPQTDAI